MPCPDFTAPAVRPDGPDRASAVRAEAGRLGVEVVPLLVVSGWPAAATVLSRTAAPAHLAPWLLTTPALAATAR